MDIESEMRRVARTSGFSMLKISREANIPYAAVHRFVAGSGGITLATAAKLAKLLGLELRRVRRPVKKGR